MSRVLVLAGSAGVALAAVLLPWFELGRYESNGWDSSWLVRAAVLAALVSIVMARLDAVSPWPPLAALLLIAVRVAFPPDFGFGFGGLDVPVERGFGCWVGLASAVLAAAAAGYRIRPSSRLTTSERRTASSSRRVGMSPRRTA